MPDTTKVLPPNCVRERRLGIFHYGWHLLELRPDAIMRLMARVIPVEVRCDYASRTFVVTAYSPDFDEAPSMFETPRYDVVVENDADGGVLNATLKRHA
jgi:hypothetical protein